MKVYRMPDGTKRQFDEANVPEGAILVTKAQKVENKSVEPANKSVEPKTKTVRGKRK